MEHTRPGFDRRRRRCQRSAILRFRRNARVVDQCGQGRACQGLFDLRRCARQHSMITEIELDIRPLAHHRCVKTLIAQLGGRSDRQTSEADALDAIPRLVEDAQDRNPRLTDRGRAFRYRCFARDLH